MDSIIEIWKKHETQLNEHRELNLALLREIKVENAKSSLKKLSFLPLSTIVFFTFMAIYALFFAVREWESWYFAFSGAVVALFSVLLVIVSIRQLKLIFSIDYSNPVLELQRDISKIKSAVVDNLRIATLLLPFSPFIGIFLQKVFFNLDLPVLIGSGSFAFFGIITILLGVVSFFLFKALRPKNMNKGWVNWLLQGSGSQVNEALGFLEQVSAFKTEKQTNIKY